MFLRGAVILPRRMNAGRRMSALTRSGVVLLHGIVNRRPSRRCVPPVIAPAEGIVRAGAVLRGDAVLSECPALDHACLCGSLAASYVRSRLLFAA